MRTSKSTKLQQIRCGGLPSFFLWRTSDGGKKAWLDQRYEQIPEDDASQPRNGPDRDANAQRPDDLFLVALIIYYTI